MHFLCVGNHGCICTHAFVHSHTSAFTELRKGRWWPPLSLFSLTLRQGLSVNQALVFSARREASKPQQCVPQSCGYSILWQHLTCYTHAEFWILGLTISKQMSLSTEPSFQSLQLTILMTWKMLLILKFLFNCSWHPLSSCPACPFCLRATCYTLSCSYFWKSPILT